MREVKVKIKSRFGNLHGILSLPNKKTKSAIIFANGLGDNILNSYIVVNTARKLCEKGFTFLRFNCKGRWPSPGIFIETDIHDEVSSLESAIKFMKKKGFSKIGLIGHSLGGIDVILARKDDVKAIVLFDPTDLSLIKKFTNKKIAKEIVQRGFAYNKKWDFAEGKKMWNSINNVDTKNYIPRIKCPTLLIAAGKGKLIGSIKKVYKKLSCTKKLFVIKGAGHTFDELQHEEKIITETNKWFKKFF